MSIVLFAENIIEDATVTVTNAVAANPKENLYDRDRGAQCIATGAGQWDIDIDLGASGARAAAGIALINHNVDGVDITVYADAVTIGTTLVATVTPAGVDPFYVAFTATAARRYWRIRVAAMASAVAIGEILLGTPRTITLDPYIDRGGVGVIANVHRDVSPAGYAWAVRLGAARAKLPWAWETLSDADLVTLKAALGEVNEGAKNLLVIDPSETLRWMYWATLGIDPTPRGGVGGNNRVEAQFEEAL